MYTLPVLVLHTVVHIHFRFWVLHTPHTNPVLSVVHIIHSSALGTLHVLHTNRHAVVHDSILGVIVENIVNQLNHQMQILQSGS